jgi:hypothetical protein
MFIKCNCTKLEHSAVQKTESLEYSGTDCTFEVSFSFNTHQATLTNTQFRIFGSHMQGGASSKDADEIIWTHYEETGENREMSNFMACTPLEV